MTFNKHRFCWRPSGLSQEPRGSARGERQPLRHVHNCFSQGKIRKSYFFQQSKVDISKSSLFIRSPRPTTTRRWRTRRRSSPPSTSRPWPLTTHSLLWHEVRQRVWPKAESRVRGTHFFDNTTFQILLRRTVGVRWGRRLCSSDAALCSGPVCLWSPSWWTTATFRSGVNKYKYIRRGTGLYCNCLWWWWWWWPRYWASSWPPAITIIMFQFIDLNDDDDDPDTELYLTSNNYHNHVSVY